MTQAQSARRWPQPPDLRTPQGHMQCPPQYHPSHELLYRWTPAWPAIDLVNRHAKPSPSGRLSTQDQETPSCADHNSNQDKRSHCHQAAKAWATNFPWCHIAVEELLWVILHLSSRLSDLSQGRKADVLAECLQGQDSQDSAMIAGLTKSSEHYDEAIKCLQERYNRPHQIHQTHVHRIVEAPPLRYVPYTIS